jgi:MbtH protein
VSQNTEEQFVVVVNSEEQYSIIPQEWSIPAGWQAAGCSGSKAQCLEYVDQNWRDMRPKSLRTTMDGLTPAH